MKCRSLVLVLAVFCTVAVILPARAHHSYANYNMTTLVELEGTVQQVHLVNPHVAIYVEIEDEQGQVQTWAMVGTNPNSIQESGIARDHLQPGDRIRARCYPIKDGSPGCALGFITPMHGDMARGHGVEKGWN